MVDSKSLAFLSLVVLLSAGLAYADGPCPCDANADVMGVVTPIDLDIITRCVDGDCTDCATNCDVNCDGAVDLQDVSVAQCQLGTIDPSCCAATVTGACCIDGRVCVQASQAVCLTIEDARYLGDGTMCAAGGCDCNNNGVDDRIDLNNNVDNDCNRNGVPDLCEIPVSSPIPGGPFFCDIPANCAEDCNLNAVPDECDIERCGAGVPGSPDCQDCNNNQVPDQCDIVGGTSTDIDGNFTPDECVFWDGEGGNNFWGDPLNWNPDGLPQPLDPVTIAGAATVVQLDVPAQIRSLRIIDQARVSISSPDPAHNLQLQNGLLVRGSLRLGNNRFVDVVNGDAVIGSAGSLRREGTDPLEQAALIVGNGNLKLLEGIAAQPRGEIVLEGQMELRVLAGDFEVDGRNAVGCDVLPFVGPDCTPPLLELTKETKAQVQGKMVMKGSVEIKAGKTAASSLNGTSASSAPSAAGSPDHQLILGGNFKNQATQPQCFDFIDGGIRFDTNFTSFAASGKGVPQEFEVARTDIGPDLAGLEGNFAIGLITIDAPTRLVFVDRFDNDGDAQAVPEAQYVDTLCPNPGSEVDLVGVNVYYVELCGMGFTQSGSGALIPIGPPVPAASGFAMFVLASIMTLVVVRIFRKEQHRAAA